MGQVYIASPLICPLHVLQPNVDRINCAEFAVGVELLLRHASVSLGRSHSESLAPNHHRDGGQENDGRHDGTDDEYRRQTRAFDPVGQRHGNGGGQGVSDKCHRHERVSDNLFVKGQGRSTTSTNAWKKEKRRRR